jgi:hypothetical protein
MGVTIVLCSENIMLKEDGGKRRRKKEGDCPSGGSVQNAVVI